MVLHIDQALPHGSNDVWIVQGDTTTSLAAGMVSFFRRIPLIHLEAGLRTYNHASPFPEEVNRRTISLMASIHIAPTELSKSNLLSQGVEAERIKVLGNSGIDAARLAEPMLHPPHFPTLNLEELLRENRLVLVTMHRRENASKFLQYFNAIASSNMTNIAFIIPVHPNPAASQAARNACSQWEHMHCSPPMGYGETQWMLKNSILLLTDSGGLQEEATWYGRATLILRETTERPEVLDAGSAILLPSPDQLPALLRRLLNVPSQQLKEMNKKSLPFGDGHTSENFAALLRDGEGINLLQRTIRMLKPSSQSRTVTPNCSNSLQWEVCEPSTPTVDVVLTVFKRSSLAKQLDDVAAQTLVPNHVWVVQNENHTDAVSVVDQWRETHPAIPIDLISSSSNTKYHGRFFLAYALSNASYVSVWDDDVTASKKWLQYCVDFSKSHNDALIGGNGRVIESIGTHTGRKWATQKDEKGRVDFVGHSWTLKRSFLRFYVGNVQHTFATGEDMQLSFALQQHGIESWSPPQTKEFYLHDTALTSDKHASYIHTPQEPRQWLICKLMLEGFKPLYCSNCRKTELVECTRRFGSNA